MHMGACWKWDYYFVAFERRDGWQATNPTLATGATLPQSSPGADCTIWKIPVEANSLDDADHRGLTIARGTFPLAIIAPIRITTHIP